MWSLAAIIGVAVAGAVVLLVTGVFVAVSVERRRHRRLLQDHGLSRGLSTYHRTKLSVSENNYSHVTTPSTYLRRSVQLPYGVVSIGYLEAGSVREQDEAVDHTAQLSDNKHGVLWSTGRRNLRRSFHGHSLHIPKTRQPRKLRKAMPLNQMRNSPLSAITEFTDSPPCTSPSVADAIGEAGKHAPAQGTASKDERKVSLQWPLMVSKTRSSDSTPTEIMSVAARASMLMRMGGGIVNTSDPPRVVAVPRSASMTSTTSSAPDDPFPPLPRINVYKRARTHDLQPRASNASLETVSRSVLGATLGFPSNTTMDSTTPGSERNARFLDLKSHLHRQPSAPRLQVPPGKQTIHGLCASKPSIHSLHPSFDMNDSSPEPRKDPSGQIHLPTIVVREETFKTINASHWENPLPLRINKIRPGGTTPNRHSMYEPTKVQQWRAASDSRTANVFDISGASLGETIKRPASVATGNPLRWDQQGSFATNRHSMSPLDGPRRGHRRQNCVRITNLPAIDPRLNSKAQMPELRQEQHSADAVAVQASGSPSQTASLPKQEPQLRATTIAPASTSATPSPFRNRPSLTPSSRPLPRQHMQPPSSASSDIPRPGSDMFNMAHTGPGPSNRYAALPGQWPLSPSPRNPAGYNGSPSMAHPFESPTLPSPALNSSSLYPRKSLVKGPRNPRGSGSGSSPSPLQNKQGSTYRISKGRELSALRITKEREPSDGASRENEKKREKEIDLRKSVMMLRSMTSEGRLLDPHQQHNINFKFYRNVGADDSDSSLSPSSFRPTPPVNKHVSGLRQSSCASSAMSMTLSPALERERDRDGLASHGSSPLAQSTSMNVARLNPDRAKDGIGPAGVAEGGFTPAGTSTALNIPPQHPFSTTAITASPSALSIWEDVSVCGDSPEPEFRTPQLGLDTVASLHVTPLVLRSKSNPGDRARDREQQSEHHQSRSHRFAYPLVRLPTQGLDDFPSLSRPRTPNKAYPYSSSPRITTIGQRPGPGPGVYLTMHDIDNENESGSDTENNLAVSPKSDSNMAFAFTSNSAAHPSSHLVQRLERAASSGQWQNATASKSPRTPSAGSYIRKHTTADRNGSMRPTNAISNASTNTNMNASMRPANPNPHLTSSPRRVGAREQTQGPIQRVPHQPRAEVGLGLKLGGSMLPTAYY